MARVKRACPPPFAAKWYNPIVRAVSSHMTLISLSARTLSATSRIPKIFFSEILRGRFFQNAPGLLHHPPAKLPPSPPPPPNSGVNSRGNSGGGIFNRITVPLIYPSRRPSAPSAERPAAPPAALRRGFARPGRCFAPGDALRPSPDILRRIHPTPLLGGGSDGDGRDATFPAGCAGAPPRTG